MLSWDTQHIDPILLTTLFIDRITSITLTFNFSIYNNQDLGMWFRWWTPRLDTVPCECLYSTMNKNFFVIFACSMFLSAGLAAFNEIKHDIRHLM